jgi:hypothetical protein
MARTLGTLAVIIGFFIYIYAANIYVANILQRKIRRASSPFQYRKPSRT